MISPEDRSPLALRSSWIGPQGEVTIFLTFQAYLMNTVVAVIPVGVPIVRVLVDGELIRGEVST